MREHDCPIAVVKLTLLILFSCFFIYILSSFSSVNPLRPSFISKQMFLQILPEGWAFFTRDPREDRFYVIAYENENWKYVDRHNATIKFGLIDKSGC